MLYMRCHLDLSYLSFYSFFEIEKIREYYVMQRTTILISLLCFRPLTRF